MNETITSLFENFTVDGKAIPVNYMRYNGHETTYVTWMQWDMDSSLSGDDELMAYVGYYDFDVYSKGNYLNVIKQIKEIMKENNFVFQPSRCSADMFEDDTGYYHKTICFAIYEEED